MKSTLSFYRVPFREEHNKCIMEVGEFLSKKTSADAIDDQYVTSIGSIDDFQFQKHALDLKIKIISTELYVPLFNANYVAVSNTDGRTELPYARGKTYYYFIKSIKSIAESSLELTLRMDTLNSFREAIVDANNWSPATLVEREHRNRFFEDTQHALPHTTTSNKYAIRVDEVPEGIHLPLRRLGYNYAKGDTLNSKFYLVYRSAFVYGDTSSDQSANAVKCFLVAEKGKHIPIYNYAGNAIDVSWREDLSSLLPNTGDIIVFDTTDNPDLWYEKWHMVNSVRYYNGTNLKYAREKGLKGFVGIYRQSSSYYRIFTILFTGTETQTSFTEYYFGGAYNGKNHADDSSTATSYGQTHRRSTERPNTTSDVVFHKVRIGYKYSLGSNPASTIPTALQSWNAWQTAKSSWTKQTYAEGIGIQDMMTIDQVDRTDARLIKIIELPYAPNAPIANGSGANLHYTFGSNWSTSEDYDESNLDMVNAFQLVGDIEPDFTHTLSSTYTIKGVEHAFTGNPVRSFNANYETKLKHSDFHKNMLFYDNFSIEIKEECLFNYNFWNEPQTMPNSNYFEFNIYYTASSNLTCGNMFSLDAMYDGDSVVDDYYWSEELYPLTLIAVRNNEVNLYNASYLNYIRAGYNYDIKAKSIQKRSSLLSASQQFTNNLIGVVNSGASGSPSGVVHAFTGLYGAMYNYQVAIAQIGYQQSLAQNQIDKTLAQSALQGTSVAGADNLSLFNKYTENGKLMENTFVLLPIYSEKVSRLFHYFGYATQKYKVPNFGGRIFFNYVKCQPVFIKELEEIAFRTTSASGGITTTEWHYGASQEIVADIVKKLNDGVFFIHEVDHSDFPTILGYNDISWNISLDKENWETFIIDEWPYPAE